MVGAFERQPAGSPAKVPRHLVSYDGTVLPLVGGFALLGAATVAVMRWAERGR